VRPTPLSGRERSRSHRGANAARFNAACRHAGDWTFLDAVWRPRGVNVAANCVWMVEKFGYVATLTVLYGQGRLPWASSPCAVATSFSDFSSLPRFFERRRGAHDGDPRKRDRALSLRRRGLDRHSCDVHDDDRSFPSLVTKCHAPSAIAPQVSRDAVLAIGIRCGDLTSCLYIGNTGQ